MPVIPMKIRELIVMKKEHGQSLNSIAKQFEMNSSTVKKIWKKFVTYGTIENLPKGYKKRKLSERDERRLCLNSRKHPYWGQRNS